jgi:hypothetical protein
LKECEEKNQVVESKNEAPLIMISHLPQVVIRFPSSVYKVLIKPNEGQYFLTINVQMSQEIFGDIPS